MTLVRILLITAFNYASALHVILLYKIDYIIKAFIYIEYVSWLILFIICTADVDRSIWSGRADDWSWQILLTFFRPFHVVNANMHELRIFILQFDICSTDYIGPKNSMQIFGRSLRGTRTPTTVTSMATTACTKSSA